MDSDTVQSTNEAGLETQCNLRESIRQAKGQPHLQSAKERTACSGLLRETFDEACLMRVIADCEAASIAVEEHSDSHRIYRVRGYPIALVQLEDRPTENASVLARIRAYKQIDFTVLAYAEGAERWPLRIRCLLLVAGASHLLDSGQSGFECRLSCLLKQLLHAYTERASEDRRITETMARLGVVGRSQAIIDVFRTILRIAVLSDLAVLLTGETGTGKECLARITHQLDPKRCSGPFIALNCGALMPTLAESELFGHRRGAFTGAERERKGLIRAADGGVLFLDEIGELSESLQAKLLRVLQEGRVLAVGAEHEVSVNVRVVAATNRDLSSLASQGRFRGDLFHRLNVLSVRVPPLRERAADILPLVEFFMTKHQSLARKTIPIGADFVEALTITGLPGNVRQLENFVCQALISKVTDTPLGLPDLPAEVWQQLSRPESALSAITTEGQSGAVNLPAVPCLAAADPPNPWGDLLQSNPGSLSRSMELCERGLIRAALQRACGNQTETARLLGITPRSVYNKVRKHHLLPFETAET